MGGLELPPLLVGGHGSSLVPLRASCLEGAICTSLKAGTVAMGREVHGMHSLGTRVTARQIYIHIFSVELMMVEGEFGDSLSTSEHF